jgi:hypothetical protein
MPTITTLGHDVNEKAILHELEGRWDFFIKYFQEKPDRAKTYDGDTLEEQVFDAMRYGADGMECRKCGRKIIFKYDDMSRETISVSQCGKIPRTPPDRPLSDDEETEAVGRYYSHDSFKVVECDYVVQPVRIEWRSRSGRMVLANDLRKNWDEREDRNPYWMYHGLRGDELFIRNRANVFGLLTGIVGNTSIYYIPNEGGLDVYTGLSEDEPEDYALIDKAVHHEHTELWWFQMMDEADLLEYTDSPVDTYDREVGYYDLPEGPGLYEFVYYPDPVIDRGRRTKWATLRKISD